MYTDVLCGIKNNNMKLFKRNNKKQKESNQPDNQISDFNKNNKENVRDSSKEDSVRILPRIKVDYSHEIYESDKGNIFLGNELPNGINLPENQKPIIKTLYEDLILCFAVDKGQNYELLQKKVLEKNPNLNEDILHQISVNALIEEIGENIKVNGDPNDIVMITAGGNFEAAVILLDNFWEQIHQIFEQNVLISIPAKDLLFICKEDNKEGKKKIKKITKGYFDNPETQGLLSKSIYLRKSGSNKLKIIDTAF